LTDSKPNVLIYLWISS